MAPASSAESFRDLLLRYRARSDLTQRQLAERLTIHRRSAQEWENGATYLSAERLEALIGALLVAGGLTPGQEAAEAQALWAAVQREAPHTHAPFDQAWFARLLAEHAAPAPAPEPARASRLAAANEPGQGRPAERGRTGARPRTRRPLSDAPPSWHCCAAGCWTSAVGWWRCWAWAASAKRRSPPSWPTTSRAASSASTGAACAMLLCRVTGWPAPSALSQTSSWRRRHLARRGDIHGDGVALARP